MRCCINVVQRNDVRRNAVWRNVVWLNVVLAAPIAACPFCKDVLSASSLGLAKGFYWSILFMLAIVFSVVGVIIGTIWKSQRGRLKPPSVQG